MENKKTAVEWLVEQYAKNFTLNVNDVMAEPIAEAKQMEKEQLNMARIDGINLANKGYGKQKDTR